MKVIGLTGSIAMGKSTAATMLARMGLPVFDSDAAVHALMGPRGAALPVLRRVFPHAVGAQGVDRQKLGAEVFKAPEKRKQLEAILHPLVQAGQRMWLQRMRRQRRPFVVLDIPLLFETGGEKHCNVVFVVSAPAFLQRLRALARPGMTEDKFNAILKSQMPDAVKRRRADFVIPSGLGKAVTYRALRLALMHI